MATYYSFSIPSQRTWCRMGQQITGSKTWRGLVCAHMLSCFSHVQLFVTLWTVACQAPLSTGFSMDNREHVSVDMFSRSDNRKWNGQMASATQWTWVWANSWRCWRTRKPGVLHSMGSRLSDWTHPWRHVPMSMENPMDRGAWQATVHTVHTDQSI